MYHVGCIQLVTLVQLGLVGDLAAREKQQGPKRVRQG